MKYDPKHHDKWLKHLHDSGFFDRYSNVDLLFDGDREELERQRRFDEGYAEFERRRWLKPYPGGRDPKHLTDEFRQGHRAYIAGERRTANPYSQGSTSAECWLAGWVARRDESYAKVKRRKTKTTKRRAKQ